MKEERGGAAAHCSRFRLPAGLGLAAGPHAQGLLLVGARQQGAATEQPVEGRQRGTSPRGSDQSWQAAGTGGVSRPRRAAPPPLLLPWSAAAPVRAGGLLHRLMARRGLLKSPGRSP